MSTPTRIMATVADDRCTREFVERLHSLGMEGVRINSAHVSPQTMREMIALIRSVSPSITILIDTKGPEIRTTDIAASAPIYMPEGHRVLLRSGSEPTTSECVCVMVDGLERYASAGCRILLDDGEIELVADAVGADGVKARVVKAGNLDSRKTLNIPGTEIPPLPAVSPRDLLSLRAAVEAGADIVAHSFVRSAADVLAVREVIAGSPVRLYAKIECREGVENIRSILEVSDGLLVARGDLGAQIDPADIPAVQLQALSLCHAAGKPSIVATHILQSMMQNPSPTRAELSDIALGVMEGASWLLLTGETARGEYPGECIDIMRRTIAATVNANLSCRLI